MLNRNSFWTTLRFYFRFGIQRFYIGIMNESSNFFSFFFKLLGMLTSDVSAADQQPF